MLIVCFAIYNTRRIVEAKAQYLIEGKSPIINVLYEEGKQGSASVVKELKLSLIGSTGKFMFFYNHSEDHTVVIPITKIISVTSDKLGFKRDKKSSKKQE